MISKFRPGQARSLAFEFMGPSCRATSTLLLMKTEESDIARQVPSDRSSSKLYNFTISVIYRYLTPNSVADNVKSGNDLPTKAVEIRRKFLKWYRTTSGTHLSPPPYFPFYSNIIQCN